MPSEWTSRSKLLSVILLFSALIFSLHVEAQDGPYIKIVNQLSGKVLGAVGTRVDTQAWEGRLGQEWSMDSAAGTNGVGVQFIINRLTGYVLDVKPECVEKEVCPVEQSQGTGGLRQQGEVTPTVDGYYKLVNRLSTEVIEDATTSLTVHQAPWYGTRRQQWAIVAIAAGNGPYVNEPDDDPPTLYQSTTSSCVSITGSWQQKNAGTTIVWQLTQEGNRISGTAAAHRASGCGRPEWRISGLAFEDGTFTVSASRTSPATDLCGYAVPDLPDMMVRLKFPGCNEGFGRSESDRATVSWQRSKTTGVIGFDSWQ